MDNVYSFVNETVKVKVHRPMGSENPKYGFIYPVNYGFLPGTLGGDDKEINAYILGVEEPVTDFTGKCVAVIHRTDDPDDKLVVIPEGAGNISDTDIRELTDFQESHYSSVIIRDPKAE
ncbi:inorganic pyrophosphatase [Candidatus Falkowbacteria bacterium]|nr:inorganic pyrophosphatase [Candidatus Falkowbacteria bacterium]